MNPRTVWRNQPMVFMISSMVAPFFRWSMATTCAVFEPSRGIAASAALAPFLPLGALAGVAFLVALPFAGVPLADGARPAAFFPVFGFAGAASGWAASPKLLNPLPDPAGSGLGTLKALHRGDSRQGVPKSEQPLGRKTGYQFRQFRLAGEGIERGLRCRGGLLGGGERADIVFGIDCECLHFESPLATLCGAQHMNHSQVLERQGPSEIIRFWRRYGDGRRAAAFGDHESGEAKAPAKFESRLDSVRLHVG